MTAAVTAPIAAAIIKPGAEGELRMESASVIGRLPYWLLSGI
jgi:hypothetical protein